MSAKNMFREIAHFLTLSWRTKRRLRECATIVDTQNEGISKCNKMVEELLGNDEVRKAVIYLRECGANIKFPESSSNEFWGKLLCVARDHKMRDEILKIEGNELNSNISVN